MTIKKLPEFAFDDFIHRVYERGLSASELTDEIVEEITQELAEEYEKQRRELRG